MKKIFYNKICLFFALSALVFVSCKKENLVVDQDPLIPEPYAKFNTILAGDTTALYYVKTTNEPFKIPIGVTNISNTDRVVNLTYASSSAVAGVQYNGPASFVIPAGKSVDTLLFTGLSTGYTDPERVDTVRISIASSSDFNASIYKRHFTLYIRKFCDETLIDINSFLGDYDNTIEVLGNSTTGAGTPYGPYPTSVSNITSTGATTATITVENIWDNGWGPIQFNLDWTNPNNRTVVVVPQLAIPGSDAGDLNGAYAGNTIAVKSHAFGNGTFSVCQKKITLIMQLGVTGVGYFGNIYTVTLNR